MRKWPAAKDFSDPKAALLSYARSDGGSALKVVQSPGRIQRQDCWAMCV